ncbi:diphthine--ammonia ligase [Chanos chanos]|uniref:Diphthine--ammonia ligase n=1 Tax=Chanos chanos TaxID=29144 RepID=A0A6J2WAB7_CHACN|nr:diphthine--ammonia ligase [Chanos chanos]
MKVVALISGGKDSCYNMMQCVAAGHSVVALANLRPAHNTDELDSYMYQTVGFQAIDLYAEAMGLPLYRRTIEGHSLDTEKEYTPTEGDEVEDLYHLLKLVKEKEGVEAVSVGAILSDYQRVRVENVCCRLRLQPLAYLWRRDQAELLSEMISSDIHALLIKVAAFGLDPEKHLGKSLAQMEDYLKQLSEKYGVHICGEGGEYETFTTDCPLFKKRIVIDSMETVIHSADAFAPVGYLRLTQMHTEDKSSVSANTLPLDTCPCQSAIDKVTEEAEYADKTRDVQEEFTSAADLTCQQGHECQPSSSPRSSLGYQWLAGISGLQCEKPDIQIQTRQAFQTLQGMLKERGFELKHVVLVHLYVRDMEHFSKVNSVYSSFFGHNPPARVCVQAPLPPGQLLQMDCLLHDWTQGIQEEDMSQRRRETLHVQSLSHWAPANTGPYSQAVRVEESVFCAGQIALIPCTMKLLDGGAGSQSQLCFSHMEKVLEVMGSHLTLAHALQAHCYVTHSRHIPTVTAAWNKKLREIHTEENSYGETEMQTGPLVVSVVPSLPRGASVELHVIAAHDDPRDRTSFHMSAEVPGCSVDWQVIQSSSCQCGTLSLHVSPCGPTLVPDIQTADPVLASLASAFQDTAQKMEGRLLLLCARVFYRSSNALAREIATRLAGCLKTVLGQRTPAVVLVPVWDLPDRRLLHVSCWLSA